MKTTIIIFISIQGQTATGVSNVLIRSIFEW